MAMADVSSPRPRKTDLAAQLAALSPRQRALLERKLQERRRPDHFPSLARDGRLFPLSFGQKALWFVDQLEGGSSFYSIVHSFRFEGDLRPLALAGAFQTVVDRHEALRTSFVEEEGVPHQRLHEHLTLELPTVDLSALAAPVREARSLALIARLTELPFDLRRAPLLRCRLFRLARRQHVLTCSLHHIVGDWTSVRLLLTEVLETYAAAREGRPAELPELPVQFADFVFWQLEGLAGAGLEGQIEYWRRQLAQAPPPLELAKDRVRPTVQTYRGSCWRFEVPEAASAAVRGLARDSHATPFMVLLAAYKVLLHHASGCDDILVTSPVSFRRRVELQNLIGLFVNAVVFRTRLDPRWTFRELVGRVRRTVLEAYDHQDVPFERVVEAVAPERDLSRNPLVQAAFNFLAGGGEALAASVEVAGLAIEPFGPELEETQFDLTLTLHDAGESYQGDFSYKLDLLDPEAARALVRRYLRLVERAVQEPEEPLAKLLERLDAGGRQERSQQARRLRQAAGLKFRRQSAVEVAP